MSLIYSYRGEAQRHSYGATDQLNISYPQKDRIVPLPQGALVGPLSNGSLLFFAILK